jgi:hypothetical protein
MVDFFNGILSLLALVVLLLTAMVAWLYVQQSRLMQAVSALTAAITAPPPVFFEAMKQFPIPEEEEEVVEAELPTIPDDRVSVHEEEETPEEEEEGDDSDSQPDDLGGKTVAQLRELLNGKGIPFNKSDKKTTLVNLLKAAS